MFGTAPDNHQFVLNKGFRLNVYPIQQDWTKHDQYNASWLATS